MTPRQFIAILAARWWLILTALIAVVGGTVGFSMTLLKEYTATAAVMLDARSPDQIAGGAFTGSLPSGYLATQIDLIQSDRVARSVIKDQRLDQDPIWRESWLKTGGGEGDFEAWLAEVVLKKLVVKPAPVSNVLTIEFVSRDRQYSANMANAFVKAYIDTSLALRMDRVRQYGTFFEDRAKQLRDELMAAQKKLSDYQQKNGLLAGDEKLDVETNRMAELTSQLVFLQGSDAEAAGKAKVAANQPDQLQEVSNSPVVSALSAELVKEEMRQHDLAARLGDSHPQLAEQRARVTDLKARVAAATARAANTVGVNKSVSQARLAQVVGALEAQRARVLRIQSLREQAMALQRDVDAAQRSYDAMQQRVNLSTMESQNNFANLTVLKRATPPMTPSSPNLFKNAAGSIVAGLLLGIGLVVGVEQLDRRLRSVDDVASMKPPILVSLPVAKHFGQMSDTSKARLMKRRVVTGLPRPNEQRA